MREITDLKEIKSILLNILLYVDRICSKNGIHYSIAYGTLIGAVRHNGFIPWDDDIDIYMPRDDFSRFIDAVHKDKNRQFKLLSLETDSHYDSTIAKMIDTSTIVIQETAGSQKKRNGEYKYNIGLYVDIFILDYIPKNSEIQNHIMKHAAFLQKCWGFCFFAPNNKYNSIINVIRKICNNTNLALLFAKKVNQYAKNCNSRTELVANLLNGGINGLNDLCELQSFNNPKTVCFEGYEFNVLSNYDIVLRRWYGDYMCLPPKEQRRSNHSYKAFLL